ncbi:hypothetical protein Scep_021495 [Stephania cephalantha]|uniref:Uncharacterized protein n=1 Tax=Stephania cephalantha TaxID=152367 RepID=A0AAP0F4P4_9MAGN
MGVSTPKSIGIHRVVELRRNHDALSMVVVSSGIDRSGYTPPRRCSTPFPAPPPSPLPLAGVAAGAVSPHRSPHRCRCRYRVAATAAPTPTLPRRVAPPPGVGTTSATSASPTTTAAADPAIRCRSTPMPCHAAAGRAAAVPPSAPAAPACWFAGRPRLRLNRHRPRPGAPSRFHRAVPLSVAVKVVVNGDEMGWDRGGRWQGVISPAQTRLGYMVGVYGRFFFDLIGLKLVDLLSIFGPEGKNTMNMFGPKREEHDEHVRPFSPEHDFYVQHFESEHD